MQRQMCTQFLQTFNFLISVEVFILIPKSRWWNVLDKAPPIFTPHSWITVLCSSTNLEILPNCTQHQQLNQYGVLELIQKPQISFWSIRTVAWFDQCFRSLTKKNTEVRGTREATAYEICSDFIMTVKLKQLYYVMHKWLTL